MKSRKHIKRRNISKKKTYKIEYMGIVKTIKAMDSRCALSKYYKKTTNIHNKSINQFTVNMIKIKSRIVELRNTLIDYEKNISIFRVIINYLMSIIGIDTKIIKQKSKIEKEKKILNSNNKERYALKNNCPIFNEFKIIF